MNFLFKAIQGTDSRLVPLLLMATGLLAWFCPAPLLIPLLGLAILLFMTACRNLPGQKTLLRAYAGFAIFWGLSYFLLQLWDKPGIWSAHAAEGIIFAARLFSLLGLALLAPLNMTPLTLGRVCVWYIQQLAKLEKLLFRTSAPRLEQAAWRCGLAMTVMASFLPRAFQILRETSQTMRLRAPRLPLRRRLILLVLTSLRLLGTQAWDVSLSIASRDLFRPGPWQWRKTRAF